MYTEQQYESALRPHLKIGLVIFPLGGFVGFVAFLLAYGSVVTACYGIPVGLLGAGVVHLFASRSGSPDDIKWEEVKQQG